MKHYSLFIALLFSLSVVAENNKHENLPKHELSIGWGEASLLNTSPASIGSWKSSMEDYSFHEIETNNTLQFSGILYVNYKYRTNNWFKIGAEYNFYRSVEAHSCYVKDLDFAITYLINPNHPNFGNSAHWWRYMQMHTFMANGTITYYRNKYIELYSSLGLGLTYQVSSREAYYYEVYSRSSFFTVDVRALGLSVGNDHFFASLEVGSMFIVPIPLAMGKLASLSLGWKF